MPENKISYPSFNKGHDSGLASNQASKNSIQERIKMLENKTPSHFRHDSGLASNQAPKNSIQERIKIFENNTPFNLGSKVSSCSIKKVLNRSNFLS